MFARGLGMMSVYWGRVVIGAFLLEVVLSAVLLPVRLVSIAAFLVTVPIGAFVFGYVVTRLMLRKVTRSVWLNAILLAIFATMIYLAIVMASPGGLRSAVGIYGGPLLVFSNAMRIAGCLAAGFQIQGHGKAATSAVRST